MTHHRANLQSLTPAMFVYVKPRRRTTEKRERIARTVYITAAMFAPALFLLAALRCAA